MNEVLASRKAIIFYIIPALLLVVLFMYIPLILTGYYGLMEWNGMGEMIFTGLDHYRRLIGDPLFWDSAKHSLMLGLFSTLALVAYLIVSLILSQKMKGANLLRKIYLIPMLLSSVAIAQLWLRIYHPTNGIFNTFLIYLGVENPPTWLADPNLVLYALFVPIIWQYAGFYILIYYTALKNISVDVLEAASMDGANVWQTAWKIKVPMIMDIIKVTVILAVVGSLKYFDLIFVMTGGGPNGASEVLASYMYRTAFRSFDFGYGSALAFALLLVCLITTVVVRKITTLKGV